MCSSYWVLPVVCYIAGSWKIKRDPTPTIVQFCNISFKITPFKCTGRFIIFLGISNSLLIGWDVDQCWASIQWEDQLLSHNLIGGSYLAQKSLVKISSLTSYYKLYQKCHSLILTRISHWFSTSHDTCWNSPSMTFRIWNSGFNPLVSNVKYTCYAVWCSAHHKMGLADSLSWSLLCRVTIHPGVEAQDDFLEIWFGARLFRP